MTQVVTERTASRQGINGLRANSLAAMVMLVIELGLGVSVNLYASLPASDHGKGLFAAFGAAVTGGPVTLVLHALLGTLLLLAGISAVVRAVVLRRPPLIAATSIALAGLLGAWLSGARFVGDMSNGASLGMAVAAGLALLGYAAVLFLAPRSR